MGAYAIVLFIVLLIGGIAGFYLYTRPTQIILTADSLIIHSAYKDYIYARKSLAYKGDVLKETWSKGLSRKFGNGWPLPLAGRFQSAAFGDVVIVSMTKPEVLQRFDADGKTLLLQLSEDQVRDLSSPIG